MAGRSSPPSAVAALDADARPGGGGAAAASAAPTTGPFEPQPAQPFLFTAGSPQAPAQRPSPLKSKQRQAAASRSPPPASTLPSLAAAAGLPPQPFGAGEPMGAAQRPRSFCKQRRLLAGRLPLARRPLALSSNPGAPAGQPALQLDQPARLVGAGPPAQPAAPEPQTLQPQPAQPSAATPASAAAADVGAVPSAPPQPTQLPWRQQCVAAAGPGFDWGLGFDSSDDNDDEAEAAVPSPSRSPPRRLLRRRPAPPPPPPSPDSAAIRQLLDALPLHLRDRVLAMADAAEQLDPLAAQEADVRQLVWRHYAACRCSRTHREAAATTPYRAVLHASRMRPRQLDGCLSWLAGVRLASLRLAPMTQEQLWEVGGELEELAPAHLALITELSLDVDGEEPGESFDAEYLPPLCCLRRLALRRYEEAHLAGLPPSVASLTLILPVSPLHNVAIALGFQPALLQLLQGAHGAQHVLRPLASFPEHRLRELLIWGRPPPLLGGASGRGTQVVLPAAQLFGAAAEVTVDASTLTLELPPTLPSLRAHLLWPSSAAGWAWQLLEWALDGASLAVDAAVAAIVAAWRALRRLWAWARGLQLPAAAPSAGADADRRRCQLLLRSLLDAFEASGSERAALALDILGLKVAGGAAAGAAAAASSPGAPSRLATDWSAAAASPLALSAVGPLPLLAGSVGQLGVGAGAASPALSQQTLETALPLLPRRRDVIAVVVTSAYAGAPLPAGMGLERPDGQPVLLLCRRGVGRGWRAHGRHEWAQRRLGAALLLGFGQMLLILCECYLSLLACHANSRPWMLVGLLDRLGC